MLLKNSNDLFSIVSGHNSIKNLIEAHGFINCYRRIFDGLYLSNTKGISAIFPHYTNNKINHKYFKKITNILIKLDEMEYICANCYSVSLYCQTIAFISGLESDLLYGYQKIDESLTGHAWLDIKFDKNYIVNVGNIELNNFTIIDRLNPKIIIRNGVANELLDND